MKTFVTLLSITCLVVLGVATAPAPVHADSETATTPSQDELLEELFGTAEAVGSCTIVDCSNTGNKFGYGSSCQDAQDDLDAALYATAQSVCNDGVVSTVDIHYGSCTLVARGQYRYSGNGDIFCKLCNGDVCLPLS